MVPLYTARIGDLKPGDFVVVERGAGGHDGLIHPTALSSLGLGPDERIVDLTPRLRCRECDTKGRWPCRFRGHRPAAERQTTGEGDDLRDNHGNYWGGDRCWTGRGCKKGRTKDNTIHRAAIM